ncbi:hypothetical protein K505DRAFT_236440 [Melanomma pulvis-pyrius CBS 109.77]|uniref:PAC domain-containing protein n=1 Tax=Melanomma pulvis-pyrius CBS 109.77 TaxID=1314802 RepID=A0A6A6XKN8_9PLEO|nr:hypothetical protein K505DRAFT_236440 [Melanomma pulvis-pyrius CBS 109.77]
MTPAHGSANAIKSDDRIGDSGAVGEPLVQDYEQVQPEHEYHANPLQEAAQTSPARSSTTSTLLRPLHPVTSSSDEDTAAPPPPDFTRRGIHIPMRTSKTAISSSSKTATSSRRRFFRSSSNQSTSMQSTPMQSTSVPGTPDSYSRAGARSSADSVISYETSASSINTQSLAPLQQKGPLDDVDRLSPLLEDDPKSFDLVAPTEAETGKVFSLESQSENMFSKQHLEAIFKDTASLLRFTAFLSMARPKSVPVLIYYLDAMKALRAINYANAVAEALEPLEGHEFTHNTARPTVNAILEDKASAAFDALVRDDLPAFITHAFIQVVSVSITKRVTGNLPPLLREASEGLAEVFCLSDPSRPDNPIIFASEEFHRTTQYGVSYAIGRNCRFLQGPRTNRDSVRRLREAVQEGRETSEVFLNYRRDGSPFMNLLMMAPLLDSRGNLRYFIGAQVDISGLVRDSTDLDAFQHMLDQQDGREPADEPKDEFQELSEMFNNSELDTVRKFGGSMHREHLEEQDDGASFMHRPRLLIKDTNSFHAETPMEIPAKPEGRLSGVYKNYILLRPAPSLRILFTSPSLRVPGILQSRFLDRIGGSTRVRDSLAEALADGTRGVTAKIRWLSSPAADLDSDRSDDGRPRWIHCTPLLGASGSVGVWMVVLVDDEKGGPVRRLRTAPPVSDSIRRGKQRGGSPTPFRTGFDSSDEELDLRSLRSRHSSRTGGTIRHPTVEGLRSSSTRPGSAEPSINSFALG